MKYIKDYYGAEFDINHKYNYQYDFKNMTLMSHLIEIMCGYGPRDITFIQTKKFILDEFKDEYDEINDKMLYKIVKYKDIEFFEYLITKYSKQYGLRIVCDTLTKMINENIYSDVGYNHWYEQEESETNKTFLEKVQQICMDTICQNDDDNNLVTECIIQSWECYATARSLPLDHNF